jgi:ribonuclease HII
MRRSATGQPAELKLPRAPSRDLEREAWAEGRLLVAGVDEAGRGALAGPVVAAAVILPHDSDLAGVADSKLLTPAQREALFDPIIATALSWAAGVVEADRIDETNILRATHQAMHEALARLDPAPQLILVDGQPLPGARFAQRSVIGGDRRCYVIAAASIIAKVTRDRLMCALHDHYPEYGFAQHKGYGSATHLQALERHGPCPIHRRSFAPCRAAGQLPLGGLEDAVQSQPWEPSRPADVG